VTGFRKFWWISWISIFRPTEPALDTEVNAYLASLRYIHTTISVSVMSSSQKWKLQELKRKLDWELKLKVVQNVNYTASSRISYLYRRLITLYRD